MEQLDERGFQEVSIADMMNLERQFKSGANWFYWLAGLSLLSTILLYMGSSIIPALTLGIAELLTYLALEEPSWIVVLAPMYLLSVSVIGVIGFFSSKGVRWLYLIGIILIGLDTLLVLLAVDIMGILFHAIALYFLIQGYIALGKLKQMEQRLAARREIA